MRRVIGYPDFKSKGIKYTRRHVSRLVKQKKFPAPFKPNGSEHGHNAWFEDDIDQHLEACAAKSNIESKAQPKTEQHVR
jgi:hypothetical protein